MSMIFTFQESIRADNIAEVSVFFKGNRIGDPIHDMVEKEDFFRYHDVFHLGIYTLTGWGPVSQHLMGKPTLKWERKLDESLSVISFTEAKVDFYRTTQPSPKLTSLFCEMTEDHARNTNAAKVTQQQWHDNLITIYNVFGDMVDNRGGQLELDPVTRLFKYYS